MGRPGLLRHLMLPFLEQSVYLTSYITIGNITIPPVKRCPVAAETRETEGFGDSSCISPDSNQLVASEFSSHPCCLPLTGTGLMNTSISRYSARLCQEMVLDRESRPIRGSNSPCSMGQGGPLVPILQQASLPPSMASCEQCTQGNSAAYRRLLQTQKQQSPLFLCLLSLRSQCGVESLLYRVALGFL